MYFLRRTRGVEVEHYMDSNRIDVPGIWENPLSHPNTLGFPKLYDSETRAAIALKYEELEDPSWDYRIGEYYR